MARFQAELPNRGRLHDSRRNLDQFGCTPHVLPPLTHHNVRRRTGTQSRGWVGQHGGIRCQRNAKLADNRRQQEDHLQRSECIADAHSGPAAKWEIGEPWQLFRKIVRPPLWPKTQWILEKPTVPVYDPLTHQDDRSALDSIRPDRTRSNGLSGDYPGRGIKPQRFRNDPLHIRQPSRTRDRSTVKAPLDLAHESVLDVRVLL
jgi:hypothetical protein